MNETSLRDIDEPMCPQAWRSWKAWTGYQEPVPIETREASLWPLALAIWLLLGFVAFGAWIRTS